MSRYHAKYENKKKIRALVLRLLVILLLTNFVQQGVLIGTRVHGRAMEPTLYARDTVYGTKIAYGFKKQHLPSQGPQSTFAYGDIVYVQSPYVQEYPRYARILDACVRFVTFQRIRLLDEEYLIRRIVALPGDRIRMEQFRFLVAPHGEEHFADELTHSARPYQVTQQVLPAEWPEHYPFSAHFAEYTVPPEHYFVAADNRVGALDSRVWGGVHYEKIIAPIFLAYRFPLSVRRM